MALYLSTSELARLQKLASMAPDSLDRLIDAFQKVGVQPSLADFIARASQLAQYDPTEIAEIVNTINRLNRRRISSGHEPEGLVKELSLRGSQLGLPQDNVQRFNEQLVRLMSTGIATITKALDLLFANARTFTSSRFITDLRPIFKQDPREGIEGVLIIHMLQLKYTDGDDSKTFYVALDDGDLRSLQRAVERAIRKAESLTNFAKSATLPTFDLLPRS